MKQALTIDRQYPREYAKQQSWQAVVERLKQELVPFS